MVFHGRTFFGPELYKNYSAAVSRTDGIIVLLLCSNGSIIPRWPCLNCHYVFIDGECCRLSNGGLLAALSFVDVLMVMGRS